MKKLVTCLALVFGAGLASAQSNQPSFYCEAVPNSTGKSASMGLKGSCSFSSNIFILKATEVPPSRTGHFLVAGNSGAIPFGNGVLCVQPPMARFPIVYTAAAGTASYAVNLVQFPADEIFVAGDTYYFQFLFRDPAAGGSESNLSNGMEVTFCL